jgi:hypothetical protein
MKKLLLIGILLVASNTIFSQCSESTDAYKNLGSAVNLSAEINCSGGDVVLNLVGSNGSGSITFDQNLTFNSFDVTFQNGNKPAQFIIPAGITIHITNDFTFGGQPDKDKFLVVEGTLIIGGTLDFGDLQFEIDGNGTIDAKDIIGAGDITCAAADGGTGTCPLVTSETCEDATNDFCTTSVMPIVLTYFGAEALLHEVKLTWITASEENNDYYTIEKSSNGVDFLELAEVDGAGNSLEVLNYRLLDKSPFQGVSYYRLKQTDYDGTNETFKVVAAEFYGDVEPMKITQHFGSNELNISNNFDEENTAYIYDMMGRSQKIGALQAGNNKVILNRTGLPSKIYVLKVVNALGKVLATQKFVMQ